MDIMTGENCQLELVYWLLFVHPLGGGGGEGESLFYPAASFTLLENMKIWCENQLMIYPIYGCIRLILLLECKYFL